MDTMCTDDNVSDDAVYNPSQLLYMEYPIELESGPGGQSYLVNDGSDRQEDEDDNDEDEEEGQYLSLTSFIAQDVRTQISR